MSANPQPNPLQVAWSVLRARRVRRPMPDGGGRVAHGELTPVLAAVAAGGAAALPAVRPALDGYRARLHDLDPNTLSRPEALAYWVNLYNAEALALAADAAAGGVASVLRVPGAFDSRHAVVAGEPLSLNDIEHGKLRRLRDPRVHGALVCGSVSCPTLRPEPFTGDRVGEQLDDQMRRFLAAGGAEPDEAAGVLRLSRVFLWYGGDFARPHRMPTFLPAARRRVADALRPWLDPATARWIRARRPRVAFQAYDWGLSCAIG